MKKITGFLKNDRRLLALCYVAFFIGSLAVALFGFAEDRMQRALGNVVMSEITAADFDWVDVAQQPDGTLISTSYDPRMLLKNCPQYLRTVQVKAEFLNRDPGEFCLFYLPRPDMEEYDANYRVWPHLEADGSYTFTLPRGKIYGMRLDPGIYTNVQFKMDGVTLNPTRGLAAYFAPTRVWALCQLVVPALLAGVIKCVTESFVLLKKPGGRQLGGK